jgi:hypothetical protein
MRTVKLFEGHLPQVQREINDYIAEVPKYAAVRFEMTTTKDDTEDFNPRVCVLVYVADFGVEAQRAFT